MVKLMRIAFSINFIEMHFVKITSQGQISIPAQVRRILGFDKTSKAVIEVKDDSIVISPVSDFVDLAGSLKHHAKKGGKIEKVMEIEKEAVKKAAVERYKKST